MAVIAIVDGGEDRAGMIARKVFDCRKGIDIYLFRIREWKKFDPKGGLFHKAAYPSRINLALIHYRDDKVQLERGRIAVEDAIKPSMEIWYGGNGAEPDRGKEWNLSAILGTVSEVRSNLDKSGLAELLNWALLAPSERARIDLPYLLRTPTQIITAALAFVCQGYLAAHFPKPNEAKGEVKKALEKMGWSGFAVTKRGQRLIDSRRKKKNSVIELRRLKECLGNHEKKEVCKILRNELGLKLRVPRRIANLINGIFDNDWPREKDGRKRDHAKVMAKGYLEIARQLGRVI